MRVLAVHPREDRYGADAMLARGLACLVEAGDDVHVVVAERDPGAADGTTGLPVPARHVPTAVLRKQLLRPRQLASLLVRTPGDVRRARQAFDDVRPDVVYVNTLTLPTWVGAARAAGLPVVVHVRELESQLPDVVNKGLLSPLLAATTVVANSRATAEHMTRLLPRLADRVEVLYNGIELPPRDERSAPPPRGPAHVVVVGRLNLRKGQDVALEALRRLRTTGRDVRLTVVGSAFPGYEHVEDDLRARARLVAEDAVEFVGFRSPGWAAMADADVVWVPSRLEPFGTVAVEAMAVGRPAVVSRVGGLVEIVEDGCTGRTVEPDDPGALARATAELLDDPAGARVMTDQARASVEERFTLARYGPELRDILTRAASAAG